MPSDVTPLPARLTAFFGACPEVAAAYLFGSHARGEAAPHSDIDVAIVLASDRPKAPGAALSWYRLELLADLVAILHREDVDLILLEQAPPVLAQRVIAEGVLLKDADPRQRVALEERILHRYVDTAPLRRAQWDAFRKRLEAG